MEAVLKKGKVRAIGVSNTSEKILEQLLPHCTVVPAVDQVSPYHTESTFLSSYDGYIQLELHLYNPQHELVEYLKSKGIVPQAYSPLGSTGSPLLQDEDVTEIAQRHELQNADVLLGYLRMSYTRCILCIMLD